MRQIGQIPDELSARKLIAYLLTQKIRAVAEKDTDDQGAAYWDIWIKNEDDIANAKKLFEEFASDPSDIKYSKAVEIASQLAQEELARQEKRNKNLVVMRSNWSDSRAQRKPLVVTLIIITIAVFMMTRGWEYRGMMGGAGPAPEKTPVLKALLFINPDDAQAAVAQQVNEKLTNELSDQLESVDQSDPEAFDSRFASQAKNIVNEVADQTEIKLLNIRQGQVWRLFTPMFIHFGIIHILFNMMWLNALGGQFESKLGTVRFGVFVLTAAVVAQVTQQLMPSNMQGTSALTMAGGMSGVNYALGGFVWMKAIYEPRSGFVISPVSMFTLILFLFIGIFDGGQSLSLANWAHGAGFVFGLICGWLPILRSSNTR